jgi:hypothetical protein
VNLECFCERGHGDVRGGVDGVGGGGNGLGIFGEVFCAVGRVEAFWEDYNLCARRSCGGDFFGGAAEVSGFVAACDGGLMGWVENGGWGEMPVLSWIKASLKGLRSGLEADMVELKRMAGGLEIVEVRKRRSIDGMMREYLLRELPCGGEARLGVGYPGASQEKCSTYNYVLKSERE